MNITNAFNVTSNQTLKNRLCKSAMTEGVADKNSFCNKRHENLYKTWANGGIGLSISGNVQVDRRYMEGPGNIAIEENTYKEQLDSLKKWANAGRQNATEFWMQISHAGRQTPQTLSNEPLAPSSVQLKIPGKAYGVPKEMSEEDIQDVIKRFVFVSKVAKEVGFTGIQLHSAHGYLLSQFLSPDINQRTDSWGGSIDGRSKLLLTIIRKCRLELGDDFAISVKLNSADFQKGGFSPEDSIYVAKLLENEGINLLEISGGTYEQPRLIGLDDVSINPSRSIKRKESTIAREAFFLDYAEKIRANVSIPLMVTGGFRTLKGMNNALESGVCDVIGIARPLCGDPNSASDIIERKINKLPNYEKTLQIGSGIMSTSSRFLSIQAINAFSQMAWFYIQIKRMADGAPPSMKLGVLKAFWLNSRDEKKVLKSLDI